MEPGAVHLTLAAGHQPGLRVRAVAKEGLSNIHTSDQNWESTGGKTYKAMQLLSWSPTPAQISKAVKRVAGTRCGRRRLRRDYPESRFVFQTGRKRPMITSNMRKLVARAGELAGLGFPVHPHMLRHTCGHYLANRGVDTRPLQGYLGHASITHTVRHTEPSAGGFDGFWQD